MFRRFTNQAVFFISLTIIGSLCISTSAFAVGSSGFENASLSTKSLSRGNAVVASSDDSSAVAFNPAGLAKLQENEIYAGATLITVKGEYEGVNGIADEDASQDGSYIPYAYAAIQTPIDGLVFGVGSNSPFGLLTKYSSTGNFRYTGHFNELKTIGYHASLGYKINEKLSVGGGFTYMDSDLKQVGKFNSTFITSGALGFPFAVPDADFELDVDGDGKGWNVGLIYDLNHQHSFGFFYRSKVKIEYDGFLDSSNLAGPVLPAVFGSSSHRTTADLDIELPDNFTFGYRYSPNQTTDFEFNIGWTGWSSFDETAIEFGQTNAVLSGFQHFSRDYSDVVSLHFGTTHRLNEQTSISGGYFYYEMAANEANYDNTIPDGDRHGFAFGFDHVIDRWTLELMYIYELSTEEDIANNAGVVNGADVDGSYSSSIHILSTGVKTNF